MAACAAVKAEMIVLDSPWPEVALIAGIAAVAAAQEIRWPAVAWVAVDQESRWPEAADPHSSEACRCTEAASAHNQSAERQSRQVAGKAAAAAAAAVVHTAVAGQVDHCCCRPDMS